MSERNTTETLADLFDVGGKRALITGATSGIGLMIAQGLAAAGVECWLTARTAADVDSCTARLAAHGRSHGIVADVTTDSGLAAIADALDGRPLHILVNNAGTNRDTPIEASSREDFAAVLDLNLMAPFLMVQKLLPNLRAAASTDDPARIINISSVAALRPGPFENFAYSSSKTGIVMLTRHVGGRLARENITVNAIAPGLFPSRLTEKFLGAGSDAPPPGMASPVGGRMGRIEDIAGAVIYLSSRAGAWVSGITLPVTGGYSTLD